MDPTIAPNLNAEIYRNMTPADRSPVPDKNLQFILVYNENSAILGASNMTDRYWGGTVWYYNTISSFDREKAFLAMKTESGVCTAGYLAQDKFVVGEDSGVLQIMGLIEAADIHREELQCIAYACQHDNTLLTLSVFNDSTHVITGGMDYCIKIWDVSNLIAMHSFNNCHTDIITNVDVRKDENSVFASTSLDGYALMWDTRQSKPALSVFKKRGYGLTATAWNPVSTNTLIIGIDDGSIVGIDVRKTNESFVHESIFSKPIHKLLFNSEPERSTQLACCCDDITIKVVEVGEEFTVIYEDNRHTDFVRGLAWHNDELLSCAWDDMVLRHAIQSSKSLKVI